MRSSISWIFRKASSVNLSIRRIPASTAARFCSIRSIRSRKNERSRISSSREAPKGPFDGLFDPLGPAPLSSALPRCPSQSRQLLNARTPSSLPQYIGFQGLGILLVDSWRSLKTVPNRRLSRSLTLQSRIVAFFLIHLATPLSLTSWVNPLTLCVFKSRSNLCTILRLS